MNEYYFENLNGSQKLKLPSRYNFFGKISLLECPIRELVQIFLNKGLIAWEFGNKLQRREIHWDCLKESNYKKEREMENQEEANVMKYSQPQSVSISIHQLYEVLSKQMENQSQKKGKDSTIKYQKFHNYCDKVLGTRKSDDFHQQNQKYIILPLYFIDIFFKSFRLKDNQLLELFDDLKDSQKIKIAAKLRYLQNKIWDLDLNELQSIKALIPTYNELYDKLRGSHDYENKKIQFENIIQEVANDLNSRQR